MRVRTRFAPSPTGFLHIGGVRTALFNWLFARQHGGQFVLRIDDTDQQRNIDEALVPILHGFRWLGLEWDEGPEVDGAYGPYFQSQRVDKHVSVVRKLLLAGAAYRDYARTEELQAERDAAQREGRPFVYSRRWMATSPKEEQRFEAEGRQGVVRLKMPREGKLVLDDLIRGQVEFQWAQEQDHVIQRADGSVLYNLATVVDDHDMAISHVIRAEEHLSNTPRQWFAYEALGWEPPTFAHLPFVAEPGSKNKLSKRKLDKYLKQKDFAALNAYGESVARRLGLETTVETFNPVIVEFYERIGYLPEPLLNYLLLLGWSLDDKTEEFSLEEMVRHFSLERVNRAPASFDPQKLMAFQARAMERLPIKQKVAKAIPFLQRAGYVADPAPCEMGPYVARIVESAGDRLRTFGDILDYDYFFVSDDKLVYDEKAFEKRLRKPEDACQLLETFGGTLASTDPFDAATLEAALKQFVEARGIKIGQIIHALRVAVSGRAVGFGMFETLEILGRERCVQRIAAAVERCSQ